MTCMYFFSVMFRESLLFFSTIEEQLELYVVLKGKGIELI